MVFPTFFNLSLNFAIRSSWSEPQSAPGLVLLTDRRRRQWHPHYSTLAWKIPRIEEPGRLQSMGLLRVRHYWATSLSLFTFMHWRRKWQPTPVFLPGESQRLWAPVYGVAQSRTRLKQLSRPSPSSTAKNKINLISISTIWWYPCVETSLVLLEKGVCYKLYVLLAKIR